MKIGFTVAAAAAMAVAGAFGCMTAPVPSSRNEPWEAPAEAVRPALTWSEARASRPDLSRPMALGDLADLALRNSPAVRAAWNQARATAAQAESVKANLFPTVTAAASANRLYRDASPDSFDQDSLAYGPSLQLNYLVLNFGGGRRAAIQQALQNVYASNFAFNQSLQDTLLGVATAYYRLVSAEASVDAARASVEDARTTLNAATLRRDQQVGTELDVLQSRAAFDQAQFALAGAEGAVKIARAALTLSLGLPADTTVNVIPPERDLPDAADPATLGRLIDDAIDHRPDLASLRARLAAAEAAVTVAAAAKAANLTLNGRIIQGNNELWEGNPVMISEDEWTYSAGLALEWDVFDGRQKENARRAAVEQAEIARSQLRQAEIAAGAELWSAHQDYATARKRFEASAAVLRSTTAARDLARDSYGAGLQSLLDLLNAESLLAQARSQHIAARQEALTALAKLAHAAGRLDRDGTESRQPPQTTIPGHGSTP